MPGATRVCFTCKESFLMGDMIQYASARAKQSHWYCQKCYKEKINKDNFSDAVCKIFGIKTPGPRIWSERKRLIDTYGYSDQTIIDCLDYLYNIKKTKKLAESICLVTPITINEMLSYKKLQIAEAQKITKALHAEMIEHIVPTTKKKKQIKKIEYDPDEWLED